MNEHKAGLNVTLNKLMPKNNRLLFKTQKCNQENRVIQKGYNLVLNYKVGTFTKMVIIMENYKFAKMIQDRFTF